MAQTHTQTWRLYDMVRTNTRTLGHVDSNSQEAHWVKIYHLNLAIIETSYILQNSYCHTHSQFKGGSKTFRKI